LISLGILSSSNTGETGRAELKPFLTILGTSQRAIHSAALQPACHPQESALNENHTFSILVKTKTEEAQKTSADPHFGQNLASSKRTSPLGPPHFAFSQQFLLWKLWSLNTFSIFHCQGKHLDEICTHRYFPLRLNYATKQLISHLGHN
jgi:hypothetical protein